MAISDEVIKAAEKVQVDLESTAGIKDLRCSLGYISKKAYVTNKEVEKELQELLFIFTGVLTTVGGGGAYILAKIWPDIVEVTVFIMAICMFSLYSYKKRKLIIDCNRIVLNERPIHIYLDSFAMNLSWSTIVRASLLEVVLVLGTSYFLYVLLNKEYYLFSLLLCVLILFLSLVLLGFISIGIVKLKNKRSLN